MANVLSPVPKLSFLDNNGKPAVGYKLFTYEAGTSTKLATYTDSGGLTSNSNPIILDYRGEAAVWVPPNVSYKYVLAGPNDTDPPGSPILTVDNIVNSQLVTLYGGVDTGSANAYVLDFTANFSSYTDGIVIYWIPSNTNTLSTGASTINVNGLGPVAILNQDGTQLTRGQIAANQMATIVYKGSGFLLINPASSTSLWGGTSTGTSGAYVLDAPQVAAYYDGLILYWIPNVTFAGGSCTVNVNGLGAKGIVNSDEGVVQAGQIQAGQIAQIVYNGDEEFFYLLGPTYGTFTVTLTGVDSTVTGTARWTRNGRAVTLFLPTLTGTSNADTKTYTGIPASLVPDGGVSGMTTGRNTDAAVPQVFGVFMVDGGNTVGFSTFASFSGEWPTSGTCTINACVLNYESES